MPDFLPRREADLLAWSHNFDRLINLAPEDYGISPTEAAEYSQLHLRFAAAYAQAAPRGSKCVTLTAAKNSAAKVLKIHARALAGRVRADRQIPDADKLLLGAPPAKKTRSAIPAPERAPAVTVISTIGPRLTLRLRDPVIPTRIAKPRGAQGAFIQMCFGEAPVSTDAGWLLCMQATETLFQVDVPASVMPGTKVWIKARWYNARGTGPESAPVYTHVGFGSSIVTRLAA